MTSRFEDQLGKALMCVVFGGIAFYQLLLTVGVVVGRAHVEMWPLVLASRGLGLVFLFLVIVFTLRRLPPRDAAEGIEPRVTAIAGTFILMLLVVLPTGTVGPGLRVFSTVLIAAGTALSAYCIAWLGRSFAIMATARGLVVEGPYRIVRHPLYAAEAITTVGVLIANWSATAALIGVVWCALQFRRMHHEERVLRAVFPEYGDYACRVPAILPGLGLVLGQGGG